MRLDRVQPARVGRGVNGLDVVGRHERSQAGVFVGVQVVHHDVEPEWQRIAGAQPGEDSEEVVDRLALAHLAHETISVDVVKAEKLLSAVEPPVGGPEALRVAHRRPAQAGQRPQFERPALVEADDRPALRTALVEVEDGVFFASNSGSGDCFQVLVC